MPENYAIWSEGYRASGDSGTATYHGQVYADSFKEACIAFFSKHEYKHLFDARSLTYWGCRLFDNEADARESFG